MSVLNQSGEEPVECPLCMEQLEVDDLNFHPCTCGYQICRFCWHRIRTDENGLCPACRRAYSENPANFRPLTTTEVQRLKSEKRTREQQRKQKVIESRQHLAAVRVVQRNLVFVLGLPARLTDTEVLKRHEYFGKFGRIQKVVINQSTSYAGTQGPSASAYVTYHRSDDALRAISAVNNTVVDSRSLKVSLGTTKYCSNFLKNQQCPRAECMYLHDLGDSEASFTKEDMQQGKHQEYERKLYEQMLISSASQNKESCSSDNNNPPKVTLPTLSAPAWGNNSTEEPWPVLNDDEQEENIPPSSEKKKKESEEPSKSRRKRKGRSRGKHSNKKQASEATNGRESSPSPALINSSELAEEQSNGSAPHLPQQSSSLSSSTSSILDEVNGKEENIHQEDISQQVVEPPPAEHSSIVPAPSEAFDWQAAFGFKSEILTNGSKDGLVMTDDEDEDDGLGFDPFAETQKALAELMETEKKQQQHRLQQSRSMNAMPPNPLQQFLRSTDLQRHNSHHDLPFDMESRQAPQAPPPGFAGPSMPFRMPPPVNDVGPNMDLGAGDHSPFSRILGNKDANSTAPFSFADWQALLPNLGTGYPANGAHRPQQPQPRPMQADWTAMDPAIMAASARPRVDPSWNRMEQNGLQSTLFPSSSRTNLAGWPGKLAAPPGFSRPF